MHIEIPDHLKPGKEVCVIEKVEYEIVTCNKCNGDYSWEREGYGLPTTYYCKQCTPGSSLGLNPGKISVKLKSPKYVVSENKWFINRVEFDYRGFLSVLIWDKSPYSSCIIYLPESLFAKKSEAIKEAKRRNK